MEKENFKVATIINVYRTYAFKNKDPIIDELRTIIKGEHASYKQISNGTNVSTTCLYGWFHGSTRRPQNATVEAVSRYLGYERKLVKMNGHSPHTEVVAKQLTKTTVSPKKK